MPFRKPIISAYIFIIDYARQNFLYVITASVVSFGLHAREGIKEMGYHFYEKVVSPEDV